MCRLAAQEVLRWILKMQAHLSSSSSSAEYSDEAIRSYLWTTLRSGQVIPGYGHAVLRKPDPRFEALMDFASARPAIAKDPLFRLVQKTAEIAPGVLKEHGKVGNSIPTLFPNFLLLRCLSSSPFLLSLCDQSLRIDQLSLIGFLPLNVSSFCTSLHQSLFLPIIPQHFPYLPFLPSLPHLSFPPSTPFF